MNIRTPKTTPSSPRRPAMFRVWAARAVVLGGFFAASVLGVSAAGCDGKTCEEQGGVTVNGVCEGKCVSSECVAGNVCASNRCVLVCEQHADCLEGQDCAPVKADDGTDILACIYNKKTQNIGTPCPELTECDAFSACPDGSACGGEETGTCKPEECKPMACISAGMGDGDSYCSTVDCKADTDCAGGMQCRVRRSAQKICGTTKGTTDPCIEPTTFADNGGTFQEGPISLLRNTCVKRGECAPCETDLDCTVDGQFCINLNGSTRCARTCAAPKDCEDDSECLDGFCIPKFGACVGNGNFCEPCQTDLDCAGGGPTMACRALQGTQRACFDESFSATCMTDDDCPTSPSGKHGHCFQAGESQDDELLHRCFVPIQTSTGKAKCW